MVWWKFSNQTDANNALAACNAALPQDIDAATGLPAAVQVTKTWDTVQATTDGQWSITACSYIATPSTATIVDVDPRPVPTPLS